MVMALQQQTQKKLKRQTIHKELLQRSDAVGKLRNRYWAKTQTKQINPHKTALTPQLPGIIAKESESKRFNLCSLIFLYQATALQIFTMQ
jgi:hypothetical protein